MPKGHIPLRTCLVCGVKKEKKALIRFVVAGDGSLKRDEKQKAAGRGCYVCKEPACLEHLGNSKRFVKLCKNRVLKKQ
jgi:hypothetical protein